MVAIRLRHNKHGYIGKKFFSQKIYACKRIITGDTCLQRYFTRDTCLQMFFSHEIHAFISFFQRRYMPTKVFFHRRYMPTKVFAHELHACKSFFHRRYMPTKVFSQYIHAYSFKVDTYVHAYKRFFSQEIHAYKRFFHRRYLPVCMPSQRYESKVKLWQKSCAMYVATFKSKLPKFKMPKNIENVEYI
jgi:hypothetical protein